MNDWGQFVTIDYIDQSNKFYKKSCNYRSGVSTIYEDQLYDDQLYDDDNLSMYYDVFNYSPIVTNNTQPNTLVYISTIFYYCIGVLWN